MGTDTVAESRSNGRDLPEALEKLRDSKQRTKCAEFAWIRAKSGLDDRLRDIQSDWELRPEALERLERQVNEGGQILVTCHTSTKSWQ